MDLLSPMVSTKCFHNHNARISTTGICWAGAVDTFPIRTDIWNDAGLKPLLELLRIRKGLIALGYKPLGEGYR
jgi:hypothetical protein